MKAATTLYLLCLAMIATKQTVAMSRFTPLEIDNHPCTPEKLKATNRYICSSNGTIICQNGWEPCHDPAKEKLEPCSMPICDPKCQHGECRAPNFCACEIGWEGTHCDTCVPLPGCDHGTCENALECNCEDGWDGAYCDIPECKDCEHGRCLAPNECVCYDGWSGENCTSCLALPGCKNGKCGTHPNTCECEDKWTGHLCDEPVCDPVCVNGKCMEKNGTHFCRCNLGWQKEACDACVPYWDCPYKGEGACEKSNECRCPNDTSDPDGLCESFFTPAN